MPAYLASAGPFATEMTNGAGMEFRMIPAGTFVMGSPENEAGRDGDETQREVTISSPFYMGATEVTQGQWLSVMGDRPSGFEGEQLPVEQVSYDDVKAFCAKLSEEDPLRDYRLPTEAEWGYACRAGTTTAYYWGEANPDEYAWHEGNSGGRTHPEATLKPNAWGLYDMGGNVWEWCEDMFGAYPMDQTVDPSGTDFGILRVRRGGSWSMPVQRARSAYRYGDGDFCRYDRMGFRVVAVPNTAASEGGAADAGHAHAWPEADTAGLQARLDELRATAAVVERALERYSGDSERRRIMRATLRAGTAHLDRADQLLVEGKSDGAGHTLRFAVESLAAFHGYQGAWLRDAEPALALPAVTYDPNDRRREEEHKRDFQFYNMDFSLVFGAPEIEAQSFAMGQQYTVRVPFEVLGERPDRDFSIEVVLKDQIFSQTLAVGRVKTEVPTSRWEPGHVYYVSVDLTLSPENPPVKRYFENPPIEEGPCWLVVTLRDPETGTPVILGNETGPSVSRPGHEFVIAPFFVSYYPVEIRGFNPAGSSVLSLREDSYSVSNLGTTPLSGLAMLTACDQAGQTVAQRAMDVTVPPGATIPLTFSWAPEAGGELELCARFVQGDAIVADVRRGARVDVPLGEAPSVVRANTVSRDGHRFSTPITVRHDGGEFSARVYAGGELLAEGESSRGSLVLAPEPRHGYYDVVVDFGAYQYTRRIVATVVETTGTELRLNGEPFVVKGTNVHNLSHSSPSTTRLMMQTLKASGFNTVRGDSPAPWQVDMALEEGLFYTPLNPFSCKTTGNIFGRQPGPPLATARVVTRIGVQRYREKPAILLWNSANEIQGETVDLLESLYPVYKELDPYNRPVAYSNLMYQYITEGQDAMAYNIYFFFNKTAEELHLDVQKHIELTRELEMPMLYTEFNSWHRGAIISDGVEALENLYAWGVARGMAGGVHYKDDHSKSHPGVYDKNNFNVNPTHFRAMHAAFDDARVTANGLKDGRIQVVVTNRRPFHLREVSVDIMVDGRSVEKLQLDDIPPEGVVAAGEIKAPRGDAHSAWMVSGTLHFTTHFGMRSDAPFTFPVIE